MSDQQQSFHVDHCSTGHCFCNNLVRETQPADKELLTEVSTLRNICRALERDKSILADQLKLANWELNDVKAIISRGAKVNYCNMCGVFYESGIRCQCAIDECAD